MSTSSSTISVLLYPILFILISHLTSSVNSAYIFHNDLTASAASTIPTIKLHYYSPSDYSNVRYELIEEPTYSQPSDLQEQIRLILQEPSSQEDIVHPTANYERQINEREKNLATGSIDGENIKYLSPMAMNDEMLPVQDDQVTLRQEESPTNDETMRHYRSSDQVTSEPADGQVVQYTDTVETSPRVDTSHQIKQNVPSQVDSDPRIPVFITRDASKIIALSEMYARKRNENQAKTSEVKENVDSVTSDESEPVDESIAPQETGDSVTTADSDENIDNNTSDVNVDDTRSLESNVSNEQSEPVDTLINSSSNDEEKINSSPKTIPVLAITHAAETPVYTKEIVESDPAVVPEVTRESIKSHDKLTGRQKNYLTKVLEDYLKFIMEHQRAKLRSVGESSNLQRRSGLFGDLKRNFKSLIMPILTINNGLNARSFSPVASVPLDFLSRKK